MTKLLDTVTGRGGYVEPVYRFGLGIVRRGSGSVDGWIGASFTVTYLAPPAMIGIRTGKRFTLPKNPCPAQARMITHIDVNVRREFKSLARSQTGHE